MENLAGITMVDPVFVDTSEGREVVADSLKPQTTTKLLEQEKKTVERDNKNEVTHKQNDTSTDSKDETVEIKRGMCVSNV